MQCVNEKETDKKYLDSCACWLQSVMTVQTTYQKHLAVLDREKKKKRGKKRGKKKKT